MTSASVASTASTGISTGIANVLAALRDAGFPGSVQRRRITAVRKGLRSQRSVEDLEPAIPVGSFTWLPIDTEEDAAEGAPVQSQSLLTGITAAGEYVALGQHDHGRIRLVGPDEALVQRTLDAHARLHGVRLPAEG
jgi:hypothetical protein